MEKTNILKKAATQELILSRLLDAPRELVFEVWANAEHLVQWWGPEGFTNTIQTFDLRPGGVRQFIMHGPDGVDYPNHIVFEEVVAPEKLTYLHGTGEPDYQPFHVTITFEAQGEQTLLTLHMRCATPEQYDEFVAMGAVEGGVSTLNCLAEYLYELTAPEALVITKTLDAPRELVFKAWAEPERLTQWWGPKGMTLEVVSLDLRPGGVFHYAMGTPDGNKMWGRFIYIDIAPPLRLSFLSSFADENANPVRHPLSDTWPIETLSTMTLDEKDGKTTLTLRSVPHKATDVERSTFAENHGNIQKGFGGTFDRLTEYLNLQRQLS